MAYGYLPSPLMERAIATLNAYSGNPVALIRPIVEGLRTDNMAIIERGFQALRRMGWEHAALDAVTCSKMFAIKNKIVQDDAIRNKLIQFSLAIKNGFEVPAGEMVQLLRRGLAIGLDKDPALKQYLATIGKHAKKFSGLMKQEKQLQQLIDAGDLSGMQRVLSGRGDGRLVVSAPSAYVQQEWKVFIY